VRSIGCTKSRPQRPQRWAPVQSMGDGFLVEFPSAVQALRCAIAIQSALNAQAEGLRLRIGVHQGEVVAEGDDPFGGGVIVAARLEPLAENGNIVISSRVKEDASEHRGARRGVPRPHRRHRI
jgi:adenylate cyclase